MPRRMASHSDNYISLFRDCLAYYFAYLSLVSSRRPHHSATRYVCTGLAGIVLLNDANVFACSRNVQILPRVGLNTLKYTLIVVLRLRCLSGSSLQTPRQHGPVPHSDRFRQPIANRLSVPRMTAEGRPVPHLWHP